MGGFLWELPTTPGHKDTNADREENVTNTTKAPKQTDLELHYDEIHCRLIEQIRQFCAMAIC